MNFFVALLSLFVSLSFYTIGQVDSLECKRLEFLAGEAITKDDFKTAVSSLLKKEEHCGLDNSYWKRLIGCLVSVVNQEDDQAIKFQFIDTLLNAWNRQDELGLYNETNDLTRATMYAQQSQEDYRKADFFFQRGLKNNGSSIHESYIVYALYATYVLLNESEGEEKNQLKTRIFNDYFFYLDLVDSTTSSQTRESIITYFEYVFPSCDSIVLQVDKFIHDLPVDTSFAIHRIEMIESLLNKRNCTQNPVYYELIDTWLALDSNSIRANWISDYRSMTPLEILPEIMETTNDPKIKAECQYQIAYAQYRAGSYMAAYKSGGACTGEYKSKGMLIAAQSVAALANYCGDTTFERKSNYLYAAQLAEQAGSKEKAKLFRSKAPSIDCTIETDLESVELSCWGITVNLCP